MNTTNLKSAITCFHFLGQPLGRDIDGNLSNTGRSNSDHGGILNLQKCQLEERDTRSILEFDAFAINITGFPVDQVHILQRYDSRKSRAVGTIDRILEEFKHHLVDLLLLSTYSRPYPRMRNPVAWEFLILIGYIWTTALSRLENGVCSISWLLFGILTGIVRSGLDFVYSTRMSGTSVTPSLSISR